MSNGFKKLKSESENVRKGVIQKSVGYVMAGLGLVAGLAWNDAIKALIEELFPVGRNSVLAKFIYAALITLIVVVVGAYLVRLFRKEDAVVEK